MKLLTEDASINNINDAILNMHPVSITYTNDNGEDQANGERIVYPVAYGISTAGNPVIRAFETSGDTTTRVPAWKLFLLSNIDSWKTIDEKSFKTLELRGLNKTGKDKQIQTLYTVSPLSTLAKSWNEKDDNIKSTPIAKKDVDMSGEVSAEDIVNDTINTASMNNPIDNKPNKAYNRLSEPVKKMTAAPETAPISGSELKTGEEPVNNNPEEKTEPINLPDNNPVSKDDVNGEEEPEITSTYNDMMDRWKEKEEQE